MPVTCSFSIPQIYIPRQILSNNDLAEIVDTNDQWIVERTGIRNRHQLDPSEETSTMGLKAAEKALVKANLKSEDLTHLIVATCTPDNLSPSVACIIAGLLNCGPIMAFDVGAACTGFIYGLSICRACLSIDAGAKILFICAEALTRRLNWQDRSTCVLFGDAAAATVLTSQTINHSFKLNDIICQSDGTLQKLIIVGGGTSCKYQPGEEVDEAFFLTMQGRDTYRHAVRQMVNVCRDLLERNQISMEDINLFIPHQANLRIIEAVGNRLKISEDRVFTNVENYGNTSAASIPLALAEAKSQGRIKSGDKIMITAFGAGLTWGAALLEYS